MQSPYLFEAHHNWTIKCFIPLSYHSRYKNSTEQSLPPSSLSKWNEKRGHGLFRYCIPRGLCFLNCIKFLTWELNADCTLLFFKTQDTSAISKQTESSKMDHLLLWGSAGCPSFEVVHRAGLRDFWVLSFVGLSLLQKFKLLKWGSYSVLYYQYGIQKELGGCSFMDLNSTTSALIPQSVLLLYYFFKLQGHRPTLKFKASVCASDLRDFSFFAICSNWWAVAV